MNVARPIRIGVRADMPPPDVRVVELTNLGGLSGAVLSATYAAVTATARAWPIAVTMGVCALCFLATLVFNARGLQRLASTWSLSVAVAVLALVVALHGTATGLHVMFLVQATSAFLLYRRPDTWLAIAMAAVPATLFTASVLFGDAQRPPFPITPAESLHIVHTGAFLFTGASLMVLGYYARRILLHADELVATEYERSERLVRDLYPPSVAKRLKQGEDVIADAVPNAVVLFADIAGFTAHARGVPARDLVLVLDFVFSRLDEIAALHHVEKIKTVGDAWMGAAGLAEDGEDPFNGAVSAAVEMLHALEAAPAGLTNDLQIRIGIHAGPVVAGVIGRSRHAYDLWGDTVNVASRLESQGVPGAVQISEPVRARLDARFVVEPRGAIDLRGLGPIPTWLVRPRSAVAAPRPTV